MSALASQQALQVPQGGVTTTTMMWTIVTTAMKMLTDADSAAAATVAVDVDGGDDVDDGHDNYNEDSTHRSS